MKRLSLISMIIVCALVAAGTDRASQPEPRSAASPSSDRGHGIHKTHHVEVDKGKPQPYTKAVEKLKGERDTAEQGQPHAGAISSQSKLPPQAANGRPSAPQPNSANASQPAQNRAGPVANGAPRLQDQPAHVALPVRPPMMFSPAATSHDDARHRGANPPALGGAATSKATNTASIGGSTMHRKP
jgi:hypothetical protein